jgi:para-aminobenzoate synthetase component I
VEQDTIAYFNSNNEKNILGIGRKTLLRLEQTDPLEKIDEFLKSNQGQYIFMALSYDLKNKVMDLKSENMDLIQFPLAMFWVPEFVVQIEESQITFLQGEASDQRVKLVLDYSGKLNDDQGFKQKIKFQERISKLDYLKEVQALQNEIQLGNIYEINFCQEFFAKDVVLENPEALYARLNRITSAPFSAFLHVDEFTVCCGSPERFLQKKGVELISQPIKGTAPRGKNLDEDILLKNQLESDPKERAENIMIVDLVRNDLSRVALPRSVEVTELCKIYSYETVHQMISTIRCLIPDDLLFSELIRGTFPMGSMTGVPKLRAMQLSEKHESFRRGLYSGSIGYIKPNGDFDLNVVIRSLLYNKRLKQMSCGVGGAITIRSIPEAEYVECQTKVSKILDGLNG